MNFGGFLITFFSIILAVIGIWIAIKIYFIVTLKRLLLQLSPSNRCISTGSLWYLLIPFFNLYWNFNVINKISYSLRLEYYSKGLSFKDSPTSKLGLIWAFSSSYYLIGFVVKFSEKLSFIISMVGVGISILSVVLFFCYWVAILEHKKILTSITNAQLSGN